MWEEIAIGALAGLLGALLTRLWPQARLVAPSPSIDLGTPLAAYQQQLRELIAREFATATATLAPPEPTVIHVAPEPPALLDLPGLERRILDALQVSAASAATSSGTAGPAHGALGNLVVERGSATYRHEHVFSHFPDDADEKTQVHCCLRCGERQFRPRRISEKLYDPTQVGACRRCGERQLPAGAG